MNIDRLEAEFLKDPNPSRTVLKGIARANGVEVLEVEKWFENRRLKDPEMQDLVQDVPGTSEARGVRRAREGSENQEQDHPPVKRPTVSDPAIQKVNGQLEEQEDQDLVQDVPGPSDARRGVRRALEGLDHQEQDELPVKRPAVVDPAIQKMNEKLDLYLHSPKNQGFFLGVLKILGPEASEAEINDAGQVIGVEPNVIRHWKTKLAEKKLLPLPVPSIQPPTIDRSQPPTHQPRKYKDGVEEEKPPVVTEDPEIVRRRLRGAQLVAGYLEMFERQRRERARMEQELLRREQLDQDPDVRIAPGQPPPPANPQDEGPLLEITIRVQEAVARFEAEQREAAQ